MKIYTKIVMRWNGSEYVTESVDTWDYKGPVALCCGATSAQNNLQSQQSAAYTQMTQQAQQVFGNDSQVFNDLVNTFAPTVAAGPSQQGFSAGQVSNLKSQAITETGNAYKNEKAAVGDALSAQSGGNNPNVTSGTTAGIDLGLAENAGNQTATEMNQINQANYQQGEANYNTAVQGLEGATNSFNSATSASNATTSSGEAASNTANQIASENNSWVQGVTGALGAIGGAVVKGGMSNLGSGEGFFG